MSDDSIASQLIAFRQSNPDAVNMDDATAISVMALREAEAALNAIDDDDEEDGFQDTTYPMDASDFDADSITVEQIAQFREINGHLHKLTDAEITTILLWQAKNAPTLLAGVGGIFAVYELDAVPLIADEKSLLQAAEIAQTLILSELRTDERSMNMLERCTLDLAIHVLATVTAPQQTGAPPLSPLEANLHAKDLKAVVTPVIGYIRQHYHPHVKIIVDCNSAEVVEGVMSTGNIDDAELAANHVAAENGPKSPKKHPRRAMVGDGTMSTRRFTQLMNNPELRLTAAEIAAGWHFCPEFDGLLTQGEKGPRECYCGTFKDGMWYSSTPSPPPSDADATTKSYADALQPHVGTYRNSAENPPLSTGGQFTPSDDEFEDDRKAWLEEQGNWPEDEESSGDYGLVESQQPKPAVGQVWQTSDGEPYLLADTYLEAFRLVYREQTLAAGLSAIGAPAPDDTYLGLWDGNLNTYCVKAAAPQPDPFADAPQVKPSPAVGQVWKDRKGYEYVLLENYTEGESFCAAYSNELVMTANDIGNLVDAEDTYLGLWDGSFPLRGVKQPAADSEDTRTVNMIRRNLAIFQQVHEKLAQNVPVTQLEIARTVSWLLGVIRAHVEVVSQLPKPEDQSTNMPTVVFTEPPLAASPPVDIPDSQA